MGGQMDKPPIDPSSGIDEYQIQQQNLENQKLIKQCQEELE